MSKKPVFLREATGLVRALSTIDLFNLAFGQVMPAVGIITIFAVSSYVFPQSNMGLTFLVAMPLVLLGPALVYSMLAAAMPRSGGEYVWVSRIIHPSLGFTVSWLFTLWLAMAIAIVGYIFPLLTLNPLVATIGQVTNNPSLVEASAWFATSVGELVTGTVLIVVIALMTLAGRSVWMFMRVLFVIVMIGIVVNIVFLASTPQSVFMNAWNAQFGSSGLAYDKVVESAVQNGYQMGWTSLGTVSALAYAMSGFVGFNFSAYTAGEAKRAYRSMPISIMGSLAIGALIFAAWSFAIFNAFGFDFFLGANYLTACCSQIALPTAVSVNSLTVVIPQSPYMKVFGTLIIVLGFLWLAPTNFVPAVRNMFAWAFDRVAPSWLADVDDRLHTPVKAVIVTAIFGEICLVLMLYTTFAVFTVNFAIIINSIFLVTSVAAILFPYRAKDAFQASPNWVKRRIAGLPAVTVVGIFSALVEVGMLYSAFSNAVIGGSPTSYPYTIGMAVAGFVLYYLAYAYRKRQGIDLNTTFKSIPPE